MRVPRVLLALAIIGISAGIGLDGGTPATASVGISTGSSPATAVTYYVSPAAQRAAVTFWTPARMAAAAATGGDSGGMARVARPAITAPPGTPTAVLFNGVPTVGVLFYTTGTKKHFCTASVTDSAHGDLVITAAHCVYGSAYATNIAYVPKYHGGTRPYGTWAVKSITVASGWRTAHDPNLDVAFLAVSPHGSRQVQAVTGGLALGLNSSYARAIEVIGYNNFDSHPVRCATQSFEFQAGQEEFYCYDFWDGTSGGPWITHYNPVTGTGYVHGVIGGFEEGGDLNWASYSPYFGPEIGTLYQQAEQAG